jgi:hypothetical protein
MIGVTAAASAGVYLGRGYIDPGLAMPVMLGVVVGSLVGARFDSRQNGLVANRLRPRDLHDGVGNDLPRADGKALKGWISCRNGQTNTWKN